MTCCEVFLLNPCYAHGGEVGKGQEAQTGTEGASMAALGSYVGKIYVLGTRSLPVVTTTGPGWPA